MNIIFEGINGSGKTTVIKEFLKFLDLSNIDYTYISDLTYETPLKSVLMSMFEDSVFLETTALFKTSLYESLVLAANHHYIQEQLRDSKKFNVYDRDFISVLAYQKDIIKKDYSDWEKFYKPFRDIMLYQLKDVDYLIYVSIDIEENIRRTELRDGRMFSREEINLLYKLKENMEIEIKEIYEEKNIKVIYIDGAKDPKENEIEISEKVLKLRRN